MLATVTPPRYDHHSSPKPDESAPLGRLFQFSPQARHRPKPKRGQHRTISERSGSLQRVVVEVTSDGLTNHRRPVPSRPLSDLVDRVNVWFGDF